LRSLGGDELVGSEGGLDCDLDGGVGVNVDVVEIDGGSVGEEFSPEGGEVEVRVGEEEEGDLGGGVGGADAGFGGGERWVAVGGIGSGGLAEEGEVVELVGERDWDVARREDAWGEEEEERERE
jgi:hypothetical protein